MDHLASGEPIIVVAEPAARVRAQPWPVVALIFGVVSFVEAFYTGHVFAFLPLYLRLVGTPAGEIGRWTGLLPARLFTVGLPLVPFWGVWADRHGGTPILVRSALVEALVALLVALSHSRGQLAAALLLSGFQLGNTGAMLAALRAATPERRVGLALALLGVAAPVGFAIGPAAGGWLADGTPLGLRGLFALDAALSLAVALLLAVGYREPRRAAPPAVPVARQAREVLRAVATTPVSRTLFVTFGLALLGQLVVQPFLPLFVARLHPGRAGLAADIGIVVGAAGLLGVVLSPTAGILGDRLGFRRVLAAVTLGAAGCALVLPLAGSLAALALAVALFGGCLAALMALIYALLATLVPEERRTATLTLAFLPVYAGAILGPLLGAALVGRGLAGPALAAAVLLLAALAVQTRLPAPPA